jgi:amidophosphoribosyltransferase
MSRGRHGRSSRVIGDVGPRRRTDWRRLVDWGDHLPLDGCNLGDEAWGGRYDRERLTAERLSDRREARGRDGGLFRQGPQDLLLDGLHAHSRLEGDEYVGAIVPDSGVGRPVPEGDGSSENLLGTDGVAATKEDLPQKPKRPRILRTRLAGRDERHLRLGQELGIEVHSPHGEHDVAIRGVPSFRRRPHFAYEVLILNAREIGAEGQGSPGIRIGPPASEEFVEGAHRRHDTRPFPGLGAPRTPGVADHPVTQPAGRLATPPKARHVPSGRPLAPRRKQSAMCGVFGVYGHPEAANFTYLGLHALQHRGQESAGIATSNGVQLTLHRGMGHVIDVFPEEQLERLEGESAIGHVRYSTTGDSAVKNAQPIAVDYARGSLAIAHNGNLTNAVALRERLESRGSIFQSASDTEVVVHLIAISHQRSIEDRIADALAQVEGAYSLLCLTEDKLIAVRDPMGIRPLSLGRVPGPEGAYVVSSEPTSFDLIGAEFLRQVDPGEMIIIEKKGLRSMRPFPPQPRHMCIFEYVYFARPDSELDGIGVYEARKNLGRALADEHPTDADLVIPVPDSGVPATIGYAEASGLPFEMALVRSHYVGRTFIEPEQRIRHFGVRLKLNPISRVLKGKRVVVVDDSIVRGTTSRKIVKMLRDAGAREVHMRISSPPTKWPCYYGIDTPTRSELIASSHSIDAINQYITADSLAYLSLDRMVDAVIGQGHGARTTRTSAPEGPNVRHLDVVRSPTTGAFCHACWSGEYPIPFVRHPRERQMRLLDL